MTMEEIQSLQVTLLVLGAYFLPTIVAVLRKHRSGLAIGAMNVLLGWTGLFYLWALIWSLNGNVRDA